MSKETGISWTHHTWNPWEGCSKISPGCANCYMFEQLRRYGRDPGVVRRTKTWGDPERWEQEAMRASRIDRVFTCSLSDFFHEGADEWRPAAWEVIRRCPHLHFQVLTKRPLRIADHLPPDWGEGYPNVWLGVSIESNNYVWRADVLRQIPARVRWISAEPLLEPLPNLDLTGFQWIVVGRESGPDYRDMDHAWVRDIFEKARVGGLAFYFKQSAAPRPEQGGLLDGQDYKEFPSLAEDQSAGAEGGWEEYRRIIVSRLNQQLRCEDIQKWRQELLALANGLWPSEGNLSSSAERATLKHNLWGCGFELSKRDLDWLMDNLRGGEDQSE